MIPAAAALLSVLVSLARAQTPTQATCDPSAGFDWAKNSVGQDVCTMAQTLGSACVQTTFLIPPLVNPTDEYLGPNESQADNSCLCSSVYYSLLSACAGCQKHTWSNWSTYNKNCSVVYLQTFTSLPPGAKIPAWAYANVNIDDTFNATTAEASAPLDGPESTGAPKPTASGSTTPQVPGGSSSSHKSNAGAIAGGVIGGLVLVGILIGGIVYRSRQQHPQAFGHTGVTEPAFYGTSPVYNAPKLYDPSDPSTYPTTTPATITNQLTGTTNVSDSVHPTGTTRPMATYTGVAEV